MSSAGGMNTRTPKSDEAWRSADLRSLAHAGAVHFMGIGGAGMSPIAELLVRGGGNVSGCDSHRSDAADALGALGVRVRIGHDAAHVADATALVITSAVSAQHPEVSAARARGIPVLKRAQALGSIVNTGTVVAVAGTHGKTTTTAMTSAILLEAGLDPTGFVGGRVAGWGGGLVVGSGSLFVVEADEYDRSFFTLQPTVAIVTSVEADHLEIYGDLAGLEDAFAEFLDTVPQDGRIIACIDDEGVRRVIDRIADARVLRYGTLASATLQATDIRGEGTGSRYAVREAGRVLGEIEVLLPGLHNVRNSLAAFAAARHVGADFDAAVRGLRGFAGVGRRFERVGIRGDVLFIDDYAHHPTELAATLSAARASLGGRRIVAVFQPHLYSRTRDLAEDFGRALLAADVVWVTDVYGAREQPVEGVTGELVADAAKQAGAADVRYVPDLVQLETDLLAALQPGDACVGMGAGNINEVIRRVHARRAE
jgi:UDP-N-acetylmuramate--alanine ligase